ncbi:MAG: hypothetical protein AAF322_00165 [Pseudomonadota bacterium]
MEILHLSDAIERVAAEIEDLREVSAKLQDVVSDLVKDAPTLDFDKMSSIQRLDRMTQELTDLGPFLKEISLYAAEYGHPDVSTATESVRLDSLRHRLQKSGESQPKVIPGEPELF